MSRRIPIRFAGTGAYVPERVLTNQHFIDYLETSDEWIVSRTGIRERRWASKDETTSTMAVRAATNALADAGLSAEDIDLIVLATATGDCPFPATAAFVQSGLGCRSIPAFDVSAACAGFLHALVVASGMLAAGAYRNALVIGAETLSRVTDPEDRTTAILMGDAAGAVVLTNALNPEQGILHATLGCDGSKAKLIWLPAGGSLLPASPMTVAERLHFMHMRGREVFKFAVVKMAELIDEAMTATGLKPDDLKLVIPHQSNLRIIEAARERLGLPREKIAINIDRFGNTSAASVPVALDEARRNGRLQTGDHILMLAIGAGLTWGAMVVQL
ncbi:MAG: beta-ketoacyl-ACP synthase III [Planctomycetota bacterium]